MVIFIAAVLGDSCNYLIGHYFGKKLFSKPDSKIFKQSHLEKTHHFFQHKAIGEWLDNQEVCLILKISPRTLQNLRDTDQISYSQMGRKIYYKKKDIQKFIEKHHRKL